MRLSDLPDLLVKAAGTFFFIGYLPLAPGTFGSLAGISLFFIFRGTGLAGYFFLFLCVTVLGFLSSGRIEKSMGKKDPGCIVIDEVSGMLLSLAFLPAQPKVVFLAFVIFRILDTLKPFPAGRLQSLRGAAGVMADDLIAGVYCNIILQAALKLNSLSIM